MKLYITTGSPYARLARIVRIEKGLEGRVEIVLAQTRIANSPYYSINPSGRVPYLVRDDGVGMEESEVICRYLDHLMAGPNWICRRQNRIGRGVASALWPAVCWMVSPYGAENSCGLKKSNRPPLSVTKRSALGD